VITIEKDTFVFIALIIAVALFIVSGYFWKAEWQSAYNGTTATGTTLSLSVPYEIVEEDPSIQSKITDSRMLDGNLVIDYEGPMPKLEGLPSERYEIRNSFVVVRDYNNEYFRLVFGSSSDVYEFGEGTDIDPVWASYTPDNFFVELIDNRVDINSGYAIFKVYNPLNTKIIINTSIFDIQIQKYKGNDLKKIEYYILKNYTESKNVTDISTTCEDINLENGSTVSNCVDYMTGWHWENKTWEGFEQFTSTKIEPKKSYIFKIIGYWNAHIGEQSIEWMPMIRIDNIDLIQRKWAWWNVTWSNYKNITITENSGTSLYNFPIVLNYTSAINTTVQISEIRLVDSNNVLHNFGIQGNGNSTFDSNENISFQVNLTASTNINISIYYGNDTYVYPYNTTFLKVRCNIASNTFDENDANAEGWRVTNNASATGTMSIDCTNSCFSGCCLNTTKVVTTGKTDWFRSFNDSNYNNITVDFYWNASVTASSDSAVKFFLANQSQQINKTGWAWDSIVVEGDVGAQFLLVPNASVPNLMKIMSASAMVSTAMTPKRYQWYHVVYIYAKNISKITYVQTNTTGSLTVSGAMASQKKDWNTRYFGRFNAESQTSSYLIDNVCIYNSVSKMPTTTISNAQSQSDSTPPQVIINLPTNTTYTSNPIQFNVSLNEAGSLCQYSLNGSTNRSMTNGGGNNWNASETLGNSAYNATFYCNDTVGNMNGTESKGFTVNVATSSCTYSGSGDWAIDCSDACVLSTNTNIGSNDIIFSGVGIVVIDANIDVRRKYNYGCRIIINPNKRLTQSSA